MYWVEQAKRWERLFENNAELISKETGLPIKKLEEVLRVFYEYRIVD